MLSKPIETGCAFMQELHDWVVLVAVHSFHWLLTDNDTFDAATG